MLGPHGDDDDDDDEDDEQQHQLVMPTFGGGPADDDDNDDDDDERAVADGAAQGAEAAKEGAVEEQGEEEVGGEEEEGPTGLLSAEAAFAGDSIDTLELDPFRRKAAAKQPEPEVPEASGKGGKSGGKSGSGLYPQRKVFFGGLSFDTTDASLLKAAVRYGKVQEATVVRTDGGKSRGFGFVTFVSHKGASYLVKEAGDPPQLSVDGKMCSVRLADDKPKATEGLHKLPARGHLPQSKQEPRERASADKRELPESSYGGGGLEGEIGVSAIAASHKRGLAWGGGDDDDEGGGGGGDGAQHPKKARKKKEEIVTVTRRQDAEPLDKRPLTMREIFPKEFWRV